MFHSLALFAAGALVITALPGTATTTCTNQLASIDAIISVLNCDAVITSMQIVDPCTRTEEGYICIDETTHCFTGIAVRATTEAIETIIVPDLNLEIEQTIYLLPTPPPLSPPPPLSKKPPILTAPPPMIYNHHDELEARDRVPIDVCPVPKTITVIEWVDCAATPIRCDVCPLQRTRNCEAGFEWIIPTQTSADPCTTTSDPPCTTTTDPCICNSSESLDLLYVKGDPCENDEHPVCHRKRKRIKTRGDGDYMYTGSITVASGSDVLMAAGFPLKAGWSCAMVWKSCANPTATVFALGIPSPGQEIKLT